MLVKVEPKNLVDEVPGADPAEGSTEEVPYAKATIAVTT